MADRGRVVRRLVTVGIVVPPAVALLWAGGAFSAALFCAASGIAAYEFLRMSLPERAPEAWPGVLAAAVLPALPFFAPARAAEIALGIVTGASIFAWGWYVVRGEIERAPERAMAIVGGVVFCGLAIYWLGVIRARPDGFAWTIALLAATWLNDGAAFFGGRRFGRTKLAPAVSPGKTREGALFGVLGAAIAAAACVAIFRPQLTWWDGVAVAALVSVAGPLGDLMKSVLKRARGVKDSGRIFPGHGGMLDRVDAVLVNAPVIVLYLALAH